MYKRRRQTIRENNKKFKQLCEDIQITNKHKGNENTLRETRRDRGI